MDSPMRETYTELEQAFDFFNRELFESRLHSCIITLQRQHDTYGYFSPAQFASRTGNKAHEIALNPSYFAIRPIQETLSVLVREMVTLDLYLHSPNKQPRRRYRNKEWADAVEAVGLMPSSTGQPGGKRVGDSVQTYIIDGGQFDNLCAQLVDDDFKLSWLDRYPPREHVILAGDNAGTQTTESMSSLPSMESMPTDAPLADDSVELLIDGEITDEAGTTLSIPNHVVDGEIATESDMPFEESQPQQADQAVVLAPPLKRFDPVEIDPVLDVEIRSTPKNLSKTRFQCPTCNARAWGKPSLKLQCLGKPDEGHEAELMIAATEEIPSKK